MILEPFLFIDLITLCWGSMKIQKYNNTEMQKLRNTEMQKRQEQYILKFNNSHKNNWHITNYKIIHVQHFSNKL